MSTNETPTNIKQSLLPGGVSCVRPGQRPDRSSSLSNNGGLDTVAIHSQLRNLTVQMNDVCKRRDFEASHHIASCMIELAPHLAIGYCQKAEVCGAQRNTFGAIEMLDKGLACVSVSSLESDPIRAAKERAKEHMVDFVNDLPFEILCHVLGFIPDQQFLLKQCMLVSKTWCQNISQCIPIWNEVQVTNGNYYGPSA